MKYKLSILKKLFKALKSGATIEGACQHAGINRWTFYNWQDRNPYFAYKTEKLMESRNKIVIDSLFKNCVNGNVQAQKYWLHNKCSWKSGGGDMNLNQNINNTAEAKADSKTEIKIVDPETARSRLQQNSGIIERYGLLTETPCEN